MAAPVAPTEFTDSKAGGAFSHSLTQTGAGTSANIAIPIGMSIVRAAAFLVAAGTAKLQVTFSPRADVQADTADWIDWATGSVTASAYADITAATGVRIVVTSGTWKLDVSGD